jgi:hypothetical protein
MYRSTTLYSIGVRPSGKDLGKGLRLGKGDLNSSACESIKSICVLYAFTGLRFHH